MDFGLPSSTDVRPIKRSPDRSQVVDTLHASHEAREPEAFSRAGQASSGIVGGAREDCWRSCNKQSPEIVQRHAPICFVNHSSETVQVFFFRGIFSVDLSWSFSC